MPDTCSAFPAIRRILLDWFEKNKRPLPWRTDYSPYATWIAEVMMQQTQMERGVIFFSRWMGRFPDIASVAMADEAALLSAWEGLGYYRRVRMIQKAARIIMDQHGGKFPDTYERILALPGIGAYTAGAIASTAFNIPVPCIDGNAERVLSRLFDIDTPVRTEPAKSRIRDLAAALIPDGHAREFNQSLMELGALICTKSPNCAACPLASLCRAALLGIVDQRPVPTPGKRLVPLTTACGIAIRDGKVLLRRRPHDGGIWGGLMMFPDARADDGENPLQALTRAWGTFGLSISSAEELLTVRHKYTSYDITLHALTVTADGIPTTPDLEWVSLSALGETPLPAPHRRIARKLPVQD